MTKFLAYSINEAKRKINAIQTLFDSFPHLHAHGTWQTKDGEYFWPNGCQIIQLGQIYAHIIVDEEVVKGTMISDDMSGSFIRLEV